MTTNRVPRIELRGTLYRLAALAVLLLPVIIAACKGDNSGGGAGY